jgi:hypothetical protein
MLAFWAGCITLTFVGTLAITLHFMNCRSFSRTVFLPFVDQQVSEQAECAPKASGNDGWLLSDWVSYSSAYFSRWAAGGGGRWLRALQVLCTPISRTHGVLPLHPTAPPRLIARPSRCRSATAFYSSNHTRDWQGWQDAVNTTFDLPRLYQLANRSDVQFGDYNRTGNCSHPYDRAEVDARKGVLDVCFRKAPQLLPRIGEVQITAAASAGPASSVGAPLAGLGLGAAGGARTGTARIIMTPWASCSAGMGACMQRIAHWWRSAATHIT